MAKFSPRRYPPNRFLRPLLIFFLLTALVYVLRGIQILTFLPGGIILFLALMTLFFFIGWGLEATKW
jgi:hypothetical protein